MSFFNKKEEVIDVEVTPYGKYLLSKGKFVPVYYELYDDDIIYDSKHADMEEEQGQIQKRIKETPRTKTQYTFESAETRYKKYKEQFEKTGNLDVPIIEKRNNFSFMSLPLSKISLDSEISPSINIKLLNGFISSSNFLNSKGLPRSVKEFSIEQMDTEISVRKKDVNEGESYKIETNSFQTIEIGEDEIEITKKDGYLLFDLQEMGIDIQNENFEVFLYELEMENGEIKNERPLMFTKENNNVKDGILYDYDEIEYNSFQDTKNYAEYYFSLVKDKEIPQEILCKHLTDEEIMKITAVDGYRINCEEYKRRERARNPELAVTQQDIENLEDC